MVPLKMTPIPKLRMHPTSKGADGRDRWLVQELPDDFQDGDLFPTPRSGDFFGTKEEARAELKRRSDRAQPGSDVGSGH